MTTQAARKLETKTCGRCGGSGKFSWNAITGDRCFGCGGSGIVYTKRGAAAAAFYRESLEKVASEIVVGDLVFMQGFNAGSFAQPSRWVRVVEITRDATSAWSTAPDGTRTYHEQIMLRCDKANIGLCLTSRQRVGWSKEAKQAKLAAALDYQDTLTKQGTPRKVAATK